MVKILPAKLKSCISFVIEASTSDVRYPLFDTIASTSASIRFVLSKYGVKSISVAEPFSVIVNILSLILKFCISFVASESASFVFKVIVLPLLILKSAPDKLKVCASVSVLSKYGLKSILVGKPFKVIVNI